LGSSGWGRERRTPETKEEVGVCPAATATAGIRVLSFGYVDPRG
jgi:hypothetical protein